MIKVALLRVACAAALATAFSAPSVAIEPNNTMQSAAAVPVPRDQLPAAPANGEMAFVFNDFSPAVLPGMEVNCPDGWSKTNAEAFLATLSAAESKRLQKKENDPEYQQRWKDAVTAGGKNVCTNYDQYPERPIQSLVKNKIGYGLNLDGDTGDGTKDPWVCAHETFTSPTGEKGIDNQNYRAQGCSRQWRGPDGGFAEQIPGFRMDSARGEWVIIMLLRGVDSLVNDDNVDVVLASAGDMPITDQAQNFIAGATYTVSNHGEWRNVLKGRIKDGVLTTESADVVLKRKYAEGSAKRPGTEFNFSRAKLQLNLQPDGTLAGLFGGYEKPFAYMVEKVGGGRGTATTAGIDCAAAWNTLTAMADGERDPKTGKCSRISSAYNVHAVRAFVFDNPPQAAKTAEADGTSAAP